MPMPLHRRQWPGMSGQRIPARSRRNIMASSMPSRAPKRTLMTPALGAGTMGRRLPSPRHGTTGTPNSCWAPFASAPRPGTGTVLAERPLLVLSCILLYGGEGICCHPSPFPRMTLAVQNALQLVEPGALLGLHGVAVEVGQLE